jgi:zinc transport system substrate-binding protein
MTYHPSLTYYSREFGLKQLPIESEGKEPSPVKLKTLIDEARKEEVRVIFIQREFDRRHAEAIAAEAGCRVAEIAPAAYNWPETMLHVAKCLAE